MTAQPIAMTEKFQLAALTDRLIYGEDAHFSADDARALDRMLPRLGRWQRLTDLIPVQLKAGVEGSGTSRKGFAAGVGSVSFRDRAEKVEFDSHGRRMIRAGQWKLARVGGDIQIEQMMAGDIENMRTARLVFDQGEPVALLIMVQRLFAIGSLCFGYGTFKDWKTPAGGSIEDENGN